MLFKFCVEFFKIGILAVGGGYGMFSMVKEKFVTQLKWFTEIEFSELISFIQLLPGPIPVKITSYMGKKKMNFFASFMGSIFVILPSFLLINFVFFYFPNALTNPYFIKAFIGIRIAILIILIDAILSLKESMKGLYNILLIVISFYFLFWRHTHPILILLCGGIIGIIKSIVEQLDNNKKRKS